MMKIMNEEQLLDQDVRCSILKEIRGSENVSRKNEAYRRYQQFKDNTDEMVIDQLALQFDLSTVVEMSYAISNVSLVKKVINKLARVYSDGVKRTVAGDEAVTQAIQALEGVLDFNTAMKKANKILKLQKNVAFYVKPCRTTEGEWYLSLIPLQPYLYDAIPDPYDATKPLAYILSSYDTVETRYTTSNPAQVGRNSPIVQPVTLGPQADGTDQDIGDPDDGKTDEYVWWTSKYHFTTDCKGKIIGDPVYPQASTDQGKYANPISQLPIENFAIDQDDKFWAEGGRDLTTGGILVNSLISQTIHIGVMQGYGQFWMRGSKDGLPRNLKVGPTKGIVMEYVKDDPVPEIGFASANPQLQQLQQLVEMYVALLLTTNNLSTSGVATNLKGQSSFPSGIAMMIDKSESVEDVNDQRQIFKDKEPCIWQIIAKWLEVYRNSLVDSLKSIQMPAVKPNLTLEFNQPMAIASEGDRLDNMKKRKDLGIASQLDLLMLDNPGLTKEEAQVKLQEIQDQAKARAAAFFPPQSSQPAQPAAMGPMNGSQTDQNANDTSGLGYP